MNPSGAQALVLAAGKGTRMNSERAKVLHEAAGLPLVEHVLRALDPLAVSPVTVVVGHQAEAVEAALGSRAVRCVLQDPPLGTGHAARAAREAFSACPDRPLLVLSGDVPLLRTETLRTLLEAHRASRAAGTVLTVVLEEPGAYGRVVRGHADAVQAIVEARDAGPKERAIREVNAGVYVFEVPPLLMALDALRPQNAQGEYYLTDVVGLLSAGGHRVEAVVAGDLDEVMGVNTQAELARAATALSRRRLEALMAGGARVEAPETVWVGPDVVVEKDATLRPGTILEGRTVVRSGAVVGPFARLLDAEVGPGARVLDHSLLQRCQVEGAAVVGPFAHLGPTAAGAPRRPGTA